jgi:hypothetical protein
VSSGTGTIVVRVHADVKDRAPPARRGARRPVDTGAVTGYAPRYVIVGSEAVRRARKGAREAMKRVWVAVALLAALASCKSKQHPVEVYIGPAMESNAESRVDKIAVLATATSLSDAEDPDKLAPKTMERLLVQSLDERQDYKFIAPNTVNYVIEQKAWQGRYDTFLRSFATTDKIDSAFLGELSSELQCDAVLIQVVDLWQKDEVDITENATPATYVGATVTIIAKDGTILFRATDENYLEGARTETADRSLVSSASGAVYSDLGAKVHKAPPYDDVAITVAKALASSLPAR